MRGGKTGKHLGGNVGGLEGAGGRERFVEQDERAGRDLFKNFAQTRAFLAEAALVDGVVRAGGEVREDRVHGGDDRVSGGTNRPSCISA